MKVLHIGDVVGAAGGQFLMDHLPAIKREHQIDMTIVNGENSAQGNGITKHSMEQIFTAGADVITTGNHCFKRREALSIYENPTVLRPANYPDGCAGHGVCTVDFGPWQAAVLNLSGTAYLDPLLWYPEMERGQDTAFVFLRPDHPPGYRFYHCGAAAGRN